ncbi:MAG: hypothetical protein AAB495_03465 [Patescibacteria group bacterium]
MTLFATTKKGEIAEAGFTWGFFGTSGVRIGEYEFSIDQFCAIASHLLGGGLFGWRNQETPEAVNQALSTLFELYEQIDGRWVRKEKYRLPS